MNLIMEEKINIAELLKDCPEGMELYCTTWENVTFEKVVNDKIYIKRNNKTHPYDNIVVLNQYGCTTNHQDEKCRIFPKGKTTWEGFQRPFKDGDVVVYDNPYIKELLIFIFKDKKENNTLSTCYLILDGDKLSLEESAWYVTRLATEEEKQKLFDAIKENGYRWNAETKTLEKLIKHNFKVGDRIIHKDSGVYCTIGEYIEAFKGYRTSIGLVIGYNDIDNWELYPLPNKFDITTLKEFDSRVLVRDYDDKIWVPTFWGKLLEDDSNCRYLTTNGCYKYCIPHECNEHLLGTTKDCDEYFKTWKL